MDLMLLADTAIQAALAAGSTIRQQMDEDLTVTHKTEEGSYAAQIVTAVDKASEAIILAHLSPTCSEHDLALLSEETEDDKSRWEKDFFWCIDPLDGTLPYVQQRPGFSVSIALVAKDGTPYIGVVYDPSADHLYHAIKGKGVYRNDHPWEAKRTNSHLTYVTDRKLKDTPRAAEIKSLLQKQVSHLGLQGIQEISGAGSVLNAIRVIENGPACMLKFPKKEKGGGSIWDFAATACIFHELGLPATNFTGGKLDLNRKEGTFMNHEGIFYANWDI
ncbi:MAG: inositol monophosphatase family protein [Bacteroidota bacterium]